MDVPRCAYPDLTHRGHLGAYLIRADPFVGTVGITMDLRPLMFILGKCVPRSRAPTLMPLPRRPDEVWEVEVLPWREERLKAAVSRDGGEVVVHTFGVERSILIRPRRHCEVTAPVEPSLVRSGGDPPFGHHCQATNLKFVAG